jgi:hypothetical protein
MAIEEGPDYQRPTRAKVPCWPARDCDLGALLTGDPQA